MITSKWIQGGKSSDGKNVKFEVRLYMGLEAKVAIKDIKSGKEGEILERQMLNSFVMDIWERAYGDLRTKVEDLASLAQANIPRDTLEHDEATQLGKELTDMLKAPKNEF